MNARKLQALRNLAERPGTPAEGALARELLERYEKERREPQGYDVLAEFLRTGDWEALRQRIRRDYPITVPWSWICPCGGTVRTGDKCQRLELHAKIQRDLRHQFSKGDRVFYSYWAYTPNCPGTVCGEIRPAPENGSFPWAWVRVKFDHLKQPRNVPVYFEGECCLRHSPLPREEAERMARQGNCGSWARRTA